MAGHRPVRIAELVHAEVAQRLRVQIEDPRVTPVSITHVKVTGDLSRATIQYLPLGGGPPSEDLIEGLRDAAKAMRGPIGRALKLRHAPELVFQLDDHTEEAVRISTMLDRLAASRGENIKPAASVEGEE
jgi:ribosome-binding factor A